MTDRRWKKRFFGAGVALIGSFAFTSAVAAAAPQPPKLTSKTIVLSKSGGAIGGLKLLAPATTAEQVFPRSECFSGGCQYETGRVSFDVEFFGKGNAKKIGSFSLSGTSSFTKSLRTKNGIGIGSTAKQIRAAYPMLLEEGNEGGFVSPPGWPTQIQMAIGANGLDALGVVGPRG